MTEPGLFQPFVGNLLPWLYRESTWWTGFGLLGNIMFSSRFILQWLYSEKLKRLVVPPIFWHQSFWGSLITALYALHVDKLPFIIGSFFLPFIYARNLWLLKKGGPTRDK